VKFHFIKTFPGLSSAKHNFMKSFCIISFILVSTWVSFSQEYKLFNSSSRKVYSNFPLPDSSLSLSFDSASITGNDSVYHNFTQVGNTVISGENCSFWGSPECIKQDRPTWLGSHVIYDNASGYKFFTSYGDTLNFDFSLAPGDSALFFENQQEKFYLSFLKYDTITVLGYSDSAKFYTIIHTDLSGNTIFSALNGEKIIVAKNLGLIQFLQVDEFPILLNPVYMIGNRNPDLGFAKLTNEVLYDYSVGDEYQVEEKLTYNYPSPYNHEQYIKYTILSKSLTDDSIVYQALQHVFAPSASIATDEIVDLNYLRNTVVSEIPFEYTAPVENSFFNTRKFYLEDHCGMKLWTYHVNHNRGLRYCQDYNCWGSNDVLGPPPLEDTVYVVGLGIFSSIYSDAFLTPPPSDDYSFSRKIIYFKKNNFSCGSEAFLGINKLPAQGSLVTIYPVPAKNVLTVETPHFTGSYITISTLSGQQIISQPLTQKVTQVNISNLAKGIYFLKFTAALIVNVQKFVKE
jgi:hypothetical protein